jgi:hypothetical protein
MGIVGCVNQLNVHTARIAYFCTLPSKFATQVALRSRAVVSVRFYMLRRCAGDYLEISDLDKRVRISSWILRQSTHSLVSLRFSNGSTAMLFLAHKFQTGGQEKVGSTPENDGCDCESARVRRTLRASGEQRCRRAANSPVPGRDAGSNASIDSSSDFRRCGTCAAFELFDGKRI